MKTFNKADFVASLRNVWEKIRPLLENIAVKGALNYVSSDFIRQLDTAIGEIESKSKQKSDKDVIEEIDTIAKRLAIVMIDYLGGKKVYILDGMHGEILFNNFFSGMSAASREWARFKGFPEGYEEFDWPEFAITKVEDAIAMVQASGGRISLRIGLGTLESLTEYFPNFIANLKKAWDDNFVEIVDGAYSAVDDLLLGAEANLRAYQIGIATSEKLFRRRPVILARQLVGWHPQLPQILKQAGFKGVVLRSRYLGSAPSFQSSMMTWRGLDGTKIACLPTTEGIPTGDYIGGVFYNQVLRDIEAIKDITTETLTLTNLEDLTAPVEGRESFYLATARGRTIGTFLTYSDFFSVVGTPPEDQYISRDRFHVMWECQAKGEQWRRAQIYTLLKLTESALLTLEKMAALHYLLRLHTSPEDFDQHQYLWKTYLQAASHTSFATFDSVTGSYFKERVRELGPFLGPKAGLTIGEKATQCFTKVLDECTRRVNAYSQQLAVNLPRNLAVSKDDDPNVVGTLLVFNTQFTSSLQKFEVSIPRADCYVEGPNGIPIQQTTTSGSTLVEDSLSLFSGTLYAVKKGLPPKNPRVVNLQWISSSRMVESDVYQIQFDEEGQITKIYDRLLRTSLLLDRTKSLFPHKKPTFKVLENGPIRLILEIRGKAAVTRVNVYNRDRCIQFETDVFKDPLYVRWWLPGEQLKIFADFPFGLEETQRENLTGLNFALIYSKGTVSFQIGNFGMQNYFFLSADAGDRELDKKINSRAPRTNDLRLVAMPLVQKHTHRYFLHIAPQPFPFAAAYQVLLIMSQNPITAFIETSLKPTSFPTFAISNPRIVVTACYVTRDSKVVLRLLNYGEQNEECQVKFPSNLPFTNPVIVDLTGTILKNIPNVHGEFALSFNAWEFKTLQLSL